MKTTLLHTNHNVYVITMGRSRCTTPYIIHGISKSPHINHDIGETPVASCPTYMSAICGIVMMGPMTPTPYTLLSSARFHALRAGYGSRPPETRLRRCRCGCNFIAAHYTLGVQMKCCLEGLGDLASWWKRIATITITFLYLSVPQVFFNLEVCRSDDIVKLFDAD